MDSKERIEKVAPVDAQAAGLLDPSFLRPGTHDAAMADLPRERAGSPTGSCTLPDEHSRRESNCLYIRVLRDSDVILEQARSRDRIGIPGWVPITEALAISKGGCCSGGNLLPLPWRICFEKVERPNL